MQVDDRPDLLIDSSASSTEAEESPRSSTSPLSLAEASLEVPLELIPPESLSDHEGLPRSLLEAEPLSDDLSVDDSDSPEEQWPSVKSMAPVDTDQISSTVAIPWMNR